MGAVDDAAFAANDLLCGVGALGGQTRLVAAALGGTAAFVRGEQATRTVAVSLRFRW